MPQLDVHDFAPQLIWLAITFVTLYILMARTALPKIANVIEERRDRISRDLDEAAQLKSDTDKAIANYEQALAEARQKAHAIAQEARDKLNAEIERERQDVDRKIAEKVSAAEARIADATSAALEHVNAIAQETIGAIVDTLIGAQPSQDEISAAINSAQKQK